MDHNERLRALPSVDEVMARVDGPHAVVKRAVRAAMEDARADVLAGGPAADVDDVVAMAHRRLETWRRSLLQPVVNATGVLLHTNLGRAPLGDVQRQAVDQVVRGYSNLEYDLDHGRRGSRYTHAEGLINGLLGCEASLVVNNNAAAVLLTLATLCRGGEVVISRGELVEIGGEFRIPDVMDAAGAVLKEVGTTNRTHMTDYELAVGAGTMALMKVHPSNYRVVGFTTEVPARELARLAHAHRLLFLHDLGSGLLADDLDLGEPTAATAISEGADVVTFSGDKLLGGPQAGIIAGRRSAIEELSHNPLLRALRVDKMTLAALEATLVLYLEDRHSEIPLWAMYQAPLDTLEGRARALLAAIGDPLVKAEALRTEAVVGGGSLPETTIPSWGVAIRVPDGSVDSLARSLRHHTPPVIARVEDESCILDLRTIHPDQDEIVASALRGVMRP